MEKKSGVSIIVPVYNVEEWLKECIESLIQQTYSQYEIILINDGSTDNSGKICNEFASINPLIKVLHQDNKGVSAARNNGLKHAKGKYIVFVDPDDIVSEKYLEILVNTIENSNSDMAIANYCIEFGEFLENDIGKIVTKDIEVEYLLEHILDGKSYDSYLWNRIFIRNIINENCIWFNENISIWEDLCFIVNYLKFTKKCVYINCVLYFYRQRCNSAINGNSIDKIKSKVEVCSELMKINNDKKSLLYSKAAYLYTIYLTEYGFFLSKNKLLTKKQASEICNELKKYKGIRPYSIKYRIKYLIINMRCVL